MVPLGPLNGACCTLLVSLLMVCSLLPPGTQAQEFLLWVEPQNPVLPDRGSLLVNCSTNCPHPEHITLETFLLKEPVGNGVGWVAFQLSNVTSDSKVLCSSFCNGFQMTGSSDITVYRFPEHVELALLAPWQPVGENLTLRCRVVGGVPRTHLSVLLLRGEEELSRQQAVGDPAEVTATVLVGRDDHGANFSCRSELDLRRQGQGLFQNSSAPRQLRAFVLPVTSPHLTVPPFLEVGTSWPLTCTLDELFPASEAQVQMALGNQMLNTSVSSQGDMITATAIATASADQKGAREIVCNVTLGGESRETGKNLTIYSFWGPTMNLSEPTVPEGDTVNVTSTVRAQVQLTLYRVLAVAPGQLTQLQINTTKRDNRRSFFCSATLEVDGITLHRNRSPAASPVLNYNGTYRCLAANSQGTSTLTVVMNVQDRKPFGVTIVMAVLVILGLVTVTAALLYVFRAQKHTDIYPVNQGNTWLPLTSQQPSEALGEEPS